MRRSKKVGIKDLKNNLSAYLREVRRGTRILVADRADVVAELHEPGAAYAAPPGASPLLDVWARGGLVSLPSRPKEPLPDSPVRLPEGVARRLLEDDRQAGR